MTVKNLIINPKNIDYVEQIRGYMVIYFDSGKELTLTDLTYEEFAEISEKLKEALK